MIYDHHAEEPLKPAIQFVNIITFLAAEEGILSLEDLKSVYESPVPVNPVDPKSSLMATQNIHIFGMALEKLVSISGHKLSQDWPAVTAELQNLYLRLNARHGASN